MPDLSVSQLAIYPVKSLAQIPLEQAFVDKLGLQNDRRWMVVDSTGKMVTQRQIARMCLIHQRLLSPGTLELQAPGMPDISVAKPTSLTTCKVQVWDDICNAIDCGDTIASWLEQFLGIKCRLVYFPDTEVRSLDQSYAHPEDQTAFSDGFPILIISQASLDDLNDRLDQPVSMARFRPNIVIDGCEAYAEDNWKRIEIGDLRLRVVKPCSRCVIPTIDLNTAQKSSEPLKTLASYRSRDNKVFFGQNAIPDGSGSIEPGMRVKILG